jgi:hypothetical protein
MGKIRNKSILSLYRMRENAMMLGGKISHLDECEHKQHYEGGKQERTQEAEVFAPPHSPESVSS